MGKLLHTSKVKVHREPGKSKIKRAEFEGFPGAVRMGVHGGIAQYFKLSPGRADGIDVGLHRGGRWRMHDRNRCRALWKREELASTPINSRWKPKGASRTWTAR